MSEEVVKVNAEEKAGKAKAAGLTEEEVVQLGDKFRKSSGHPKSLEAHHRRVFYLFCDEFGLEMEAIDMPFLEGRRELFAEDGEFMKNSDNFRRKNDEVVLSAVGEEKKKDHDVKVAKAGKENLKNQLKAYFNGEEKGASLEVGSSEVGSSEVGSSEVGSSEVGTSNKKEKPDGDGETPSSSQKKKERREKKEKKEKKERKKGNGDSEDEN